MNTFYRLGERSRSVRAYRWIPISALLYAASACSSEDENGGDSVPTETTTDTVTATNTDTGVGGTGTGGLGTGGETGNTGGTGVNTTCPGDAANAYQGTPGTIPGTIEAENFDEGGYSDSSTGNEGGAYRTDVDVDIKTLGGGYAVGWMTAGEWLEYTVNVPAGGDYYITAHAGAVDAGRVLEISQCDAALATIDVPQVSDWGEIAANSTGPVHLGAGLQVIRVTVGASDYIDLDAISFDTAPNQGTGGTPGTGGTGGGETGGTGGGGTGGGETGGTGGLTKFVGNIDTRSSVNPPGREFATYWDQITPENAGKWGTVQAGGKGTWNWGTLDAIYDYAQQHNIIFKQHTFVWGSQEPDWKYSATAEDVRLWIQTFCQRYPDTRLIDVVNEPPPHTTPEVAEELSQVASSNGINGEWNWITQAFLWAEEYCPADAILILNDYNNIEWQDQTQNFINIANAIKAQGAPIDAVGCQAHGLGSTISTDTMKSLITKIHDDTGLPVYVTEYDIGTADDQAQLTKYQEHITFYNETEWIHGITLWGWIRGATWVSDTGIINEDNTPRPAMTWLMDYLNRPAP